MIRLAHESVLKLTFNTNCNLGRILTLLKNMRIGPMDFADACVVTMGEEHAAYAA